jgi:hypothetical protein
VDPPDRTSEAPWGINDVIAERTEIGGRNYVFGMTPDNISRIVYQPLDGTAVDLTLYPIGPLGPPAQVFGQFVDDTSRTWHLIAHERQEDPTDASTTTTSTTTTTTTSTTTTTTTSTTTTTTYARRVGTLPASQ